ncbi:hypothetical protein NEAUS03_0414 [Nematocida ausubeli]|nr:hypothetical protein NEAUS03_0414 [Nematocida ausubeli]
MDLLKSAKQDTSESASKRTELLENIKKVAEEIIQETSTISKWISQTAHQTLRNYQRQRQEAVRREGLLQNTLAQLKEENIKLLEERQRLAQKTETEQEEIKNMKASQQGMEERQRQALQKKYVLGQTLSQMSAHIVQLKRALKQEEEKEEKERVRIKKEIEYYSRLFDLSITAVEDGSVLFLFKIHESVYYFQISMTDTYHIVKASIDEKRYKPALKELEDTHDVFMFVKRMKDLFEEESTRKLKENSV